MFEDNQSGQVKVRPNLCYLKVTGVDLKAAAVLKNAGFDLTRFIPYWPLSSQFLPITLSSKLLEFHEISAQLNLDLRIQTQDLF